MVDTAKDALLISRIGGDELVIVCRSRIADAPQSALMCANQIIDAIEAPIRFEDKTLHVGASIGIAFATSDIDSSDALLALADEALYNAKREGRGTARIYDPKESDVVNL
ncbi:diguanylate cyclase domain-containing protein [Pseudooctadecabacter sp.]|uniref:diguanylate cyclase domain-containing protein n=1 Tax=Pseudooctadecabacter sp. TaxID=1966338 RepID=UPI003F6B242E